MSDYILSPQVSRGLSDKLYDKRKGAALEVERYYLRDWHMHACICMNARNHTVVFMVPKGRTHRIAHTSHYKQDSHNW